MEFGCFSIEKKKKKKEKEMGGGGGGGVGGEKGRDTDRSHYVK